MARSIYRSKYGRLRNLMEHDAVCLLLIKSEHLAQMPTDGLSLAVFIGSEPHFLNILGTASQFAHKFFLIFRYLIVRLQRLGVYTQLFLFKVAYMTKT